VLMTRVQPAATAHGWTYAGYANDDRSATVSFCKRIPLGGPVSSVPAVAGTTVYVVTHTPGDARVAALDAVSGTIRWQRPVGPKVSPTSPHVIDGHVFVTVLDRELTVRTLDARTGVEQWKSAPTSWLNPGMGFARPVPDGWQDAGMAAEAGTLIAGGVRYYGGYGTLTGGWTADTVGVPVRQVGPTPGGTDQVNGPAGAGSGVVCFGTSGGPLSGDTHPTDGNLYAFDAPGI